MKWILRLFYAAAVAAVLCLLYYRIWFLRQPHRDIPGNNALFLSPANGVITGILPWTADTLTVLKKDLGAIRLWSKDVDTAGTIISIQMDVTNVHYQRAPLACRLVTEKYVAGNFHNAVRMNNELGIRFENENNQLLFEAENGKRFKLVQIAGFLARRIEDYVRPGQELKQGDVLGLIKLGSQVTVILPSGVNVRAKVGDVVTDGTTVLADF